MKHFIEVNGRNFERTDEYESDGAKVVHFVSVDRFYRRGALALHRRETAQGWAWWLWLDRRAVKVGGYRTPEEALAKGIEALIGKRDRLTEILEGWT